MKEEDRETLRILSLFLHYPEETPAGPTVTGLTAGPWKQVLEDFKKYQEARALLRLQEEYTLTFDLNPSICLNLACHHPEPQGRGRLLMWLREEYEEGGYEVLPGQLPDYLPLVLEFLSVCDDSARRRICGEYSGVVGLLASRLEQGSSPYAGLMGLARDFFARNYFPE